jgi:hypothetical protein
MLLNYESFGLKLPLCAGEAGVMSSDFIVSADKQFEKQESMHNNTDRN